MSHSAAVKETTAVWIAVDALHLIATALWAGVLPFLWWIVLRGAKPSASPLAVPAYAARRFSALAISSLIVLGATGILQSWIHVRETSALWGTPYGQVLLLKLMGVLAMAGVACWNFVSTRPALAQATSVRPAQPAALRRIGAESALGVSIFCVTGFLTVLPPAAHRGHQNPGATGSHGAHPPARLAAAAGASVRILTPKPEQTFKGDQISIRFVLVKGKRAEHVHAYVDGALMGMFKGETGTLTGILPGAHTLELRAVTGDHQTEVDAIARVDFFVR